MDFIDFNAEFGYAESPRPNPGPVYQAEMACSDEIDMPTYTTESGNNGILATDQVSQKNLIPPQVIPSIQSVTETELTPFNSVRIFETDSVFNNYSQNPALSQTAVVTQLTPSPPDKESKVNLTLRNVTFCGCYIKTNNSDIILLSCPTCKYLACCQNCWTFNNRQMKYKCIKCKRSYQRKIKNEGFEISNEEC